MDALTILYVVSSVITIIAAVYSAARWVASWVRSSSRKARRRGRATYELLAAGVTTTTLLIIDTVVTWNRLSTATNVVRIVVASVGVLANIWVWVYPVG